LAVIIGQRTTVTTGVASTGIISVDWSTTMQPERYYTFGAKGAFMTLYTTTVSVSFSVYGGASSTLSVGSPSYTCQDAKTQIQVSISPQGCSGSPVGFSGKVFVSSYSYSKESGSYGTEQWQCTANLPGSGGLPGNNSAHKVLPKYMMQGESDGTIEGSSSLVGMSLTNTVNFVKGSVRASQMSLGEASSTTYGTIQSIGGSRFWIDGQKDRGGKASANGSIQLIPYYGT